MKKTLSTLLAAVLAAGAVTAVSATYVPTPAPVVLGEFTASANYPGSTATFPEVTTGQLLTGTIIAGQEADLESAVTLFDGDATTSCKMRGNNNWVGIQLDQAYQLTEVRYIPDPEISAGDSGWFWLQGSNDGENWINVILMRQDATGKQYHIFTPQTVTDQRYIDAGYGKRTDESIHWLDDGGSYSIYRIIMNTIGDVEFYGNPAPATELTAETASNRNISRPYYYPHKVHIRTNDVIKNSVDGSLVGTIIAGGGVWSKALYERAFDGNEKTHYDPCVLGPECWVGMMFDEPYALTEVRLLPKRGTQMDISYGHFQGSLDGHNWVDLAVFTEEDVPSQQDWVIKSITDTKGYTHFRYVSAEQRQSTVAELLIFGAPAEAAEPFTVAPLTATKSYYDGEIIYHTSKNVVTDTEISGTPICGIYNRGSIDRECGFWTPFDGDTATGYWAAARSYGSHVWFGLASDEPTVAGQVMMYKPTTNLHNKNLYFQGSLDGKTWVDLAVFNGNVDTVPEDGWWIADISDPTAYSFFRVMNDAMEHPESDMGVEELKIYAAAAQVPETSAPETTVPETASPETAAPETEAPAVTPADTSAPDTSAPDTSAPETSAPETTAPETTAPSVGTDEPTAPQTFDFGVIAAAAAIISAAGYALTKKRK